MAALDTIADRQAQWSKTADRMKSKLDGARWSVFAFSVLGALLAAVASQLGKPAAAAASSGFSNEPRTWIALLGAAFLLSVTFFTQRLLGQPKVTAWVRARALAEALKREAYKFAAGAKPYDQADAEPLLEAERQKIEKDGDDLVGELVIEAGPGSVPRQKLTAADYLTKRVDNQIKYYQRCASKYRKVAKGLRASEFVLALAATLITAFASVAGNSFPLFGVPFDLAALTAVLTTVAGAVLAHVEALRYDFLTTTYLATARRLEDRKGGSQAPFSDFVNDCEGILATENNSWIAKWSKPESK